MEVANLSIKYRSEIFNYLALNALTEINLICKTLLKVHNEAMNREYYIN